MKAMAKVEIYYRDGCPYCGRALALLRGKGVAIEGHDVGFYAGPLKQEMIARAGGRNTVPQIFINDAHIGGCDDLVALEANGQLDHLLAQSAD
jgi:glutaredoxin 3